MLLKIAYCDDDAGSLAQIAALLEEYQHLRGVHLSCSAFSSALELLAAMEDGLRPDVLLLDVIMPGEDGISAAREIRQYDKRVKIIFLTSSPEYAVQSYGVDAYYYQLKPIQAERFFPVLDGALDECRRAEEQGIVLRSKSGIVCIQPENLMYCEVIGRTLRFYMDNGQTVESAGGLDKFSGQLAEDERFLRVHRSFLVNLDFVQNISYRGLQLTNQTEIPIPHGKLSEVKERYLAYAFSRKRVLL